MANDAGAAFRALHHQGKPFIVPNPWDLGSARIFEAKGFQALATTSSGFVFSRGRPEGTLTRDEVLAHSREIVGAVGVPVSADLEDGYADSLDQVAETYRLARAVGLAGGSIEDFRQGAADPRYGFEAAVDRVRAAVEGAGGGRGPGGDFVLTARCENYLYGLRDLGDTIRRLQAYQDAGADVLFAPGLTTAEEVRAVVSSIDRPLNVIVGLKDTRFTVAELAELGVARISLGSSLFRCAAAATLQAVDEMLDGSFEFAQQATPFTELNRLFAG